MKEYEKLFGDLDNPPKIFPNCFIDITNKQFANRIKMWNAIVPKCGYESTIMELIYLWYAQKKWKVLCPISATPSSSVVASLLGLKYYGYYHNMENIEEAKELLRKYNLDATIQHGDIRNIGYMFRDKADLIVFVPEFYADCNDSYSYDEYVVYITQVIGNLRNKLKENRFFCVLLYNHVDSNKELEVAITNTLLNSNYVFVADINFGSMLQKNDDSYKYRQLQNTADKLLVFYKGNVNNIPKYYSEMFEVSK